MSPCNLMHSRTVRTVMLREPRCALGWTLPLYYTRLSYMCFAFVQNVDGENLNTRLLQYQPDH
jgi:hypothetical protein